MAEPLLVLEIVPDREPAPTVNGTLLLLVPFTITVNAPVVAPDGTVATILLPVQLETGA
jgi:hypothetical protein